jgi:hypothetical protein
MVMLEPMGRYGFLALFCALSLPAGLPTEEPPLRATELRPNAVLSAVLPSDTSNAGDKLVFRSAARDEGSPITPALVGDRRDAEQLAKADAGLVTAISELERQAHDLTNPSLRALVAERARALLVLTSDLQIMRGRYAAALWLSDRAQQVATRTFASVSVEAAGGAERLGRELVKSVPHGVTAIHQELQPDQLLTWVVRDGEVNFVSRPIRAAVLAADIDRLRTHPNVSNAQRLYDVLLRPIGRYTKGSQLLVYSRMPALRGVPVAVLHDGESFLIERQPIAITPSLSAFIAALGQTASAGNGAAMITLPVPAPGSPRLAGASEEARVVAGLYGARGFSLLESDASAATFLAKASQFDVIHIGTHGHADTQPLQSAVEFGTDRVYAWEILNLRLTRRPVVILAGCRTSDETEGRITISLSSAFVAAGASAVVGSLWNVEDRSTARLMIDFHRHLSQGVSPANALALAQQSAIARHEDVASWGAFQIQM